MATRSLTEVFILMRNNALQNRHIFSDQVSKPDPSSAKLLIQGSTPTTPEVLKRTFYGEVRPVFNGSTMLADDRMALVGRDSDLELGIASTRNTRLPPEWVDGVEEIQFEISRIKPKIKELQAVHDKHLNRPTLDDNIEEEHIIEIQTQEITQMFMRCQRLVQQINAKSRIGSHQEQKLTGNIVASQARTLQDLSTTFRKAQSTYLKKLRMREERSKHYFETDLVPADSYVPDEVDELYDRGFTSNQMQLVEDNSQMAIERDKEINKIVQSISDLNDIFKDLASMIVDQGTILDRIDYNIEQTGTRVEEGLKHLQKAEKYQKKNRKMLVILVLFVIVIIMMIILIAIKS